MDAQFEVVDVSDWELARPEPDGRSGKDWLREPGVPTSSRERDWLFKPAVVQNNGERQGGDWSEKIVSELAQLLGVPCAEIRLATRHGDRGSISRNVTPDRWNLIPGFVWMAAFLPGYGGGQRVAGSPGHSLQNIWRVLEGCTAPPGLAGMDAAGAFTGFLVLDAWVANQDRHDRNWAVLGRADAPDVPRLAPSFDHTSSLGFNLLDSTRCRMLDEPQAIERWVAKGRANQFEHDSDLPRSAIPTLVELARRAVRAEVGSANDYWFERLRLVDQEAIESVVTRVPELSDPAARFILEMLEANRRRLIGDR